MNRTRFTIHAFTIGLLLTLACDSIDAAQTNKDLATSHAAATVSPLLETSDIDGGTDSTQSSSALLSRPPSVARQAAPTAPVFLQQPTAVRHHDDRFLDGLFWGHMMSGGSSHTREVVHHVPLVAPAPVPSIPNYTAPSTQTRTVVPPTRVQTAYSKPATTTRAVSVSTRSISSPMPTTRRFTVTSRGRR